MSATYTPGSGTSRDRMRMLITDVDMSAALFQDEELDDILLLEGDLWLAAALALDTIASSETLVLKRITVLDLTTDGPAVAKSLREHADRLRARSASLVETDDYDGLFDYGEQVVDPFSQRERLLRQASREDE